MDVGSETNGSGLDFPMVSHIDFFHKEYYLTSFNLWFRIVGKWWKLINCQSTLCYKQYSNLHQHLLLETYYCTDKAFTSLFYSITHVGS